MLYQKTKHGIYLFLGLLSISIFSGGCKKKSLANDVVPGDYFCGGIVAYILQPGDPGYDTRIKHGLIVTQSDQGFRIPWYNGTSPVIVTSELLGKGNQNTNTIVDSQGNGTYAAKLCSDLVLGGFDDWFLPSKDELNKIYLNRSLIGGFATNWYWTSTEFDNGSVWGQDFYGGFQGHTSKDAQGYVRAIRSF